MEFTIGDQTFMVRGLKRKEVKALRKEGFPLESVGALEDVDKREEGLDRIIDLATNADPDEMTPGEALELWARIVEATYGSEGLLKKFESPPPSDSKGGGETAPSAKKQASRRKGTARKSKKKRG